MTLTLACDLDMRTRPRFFSSLRNYRAESRYLQLCSFQVMERTDTRTL